ncbi:MAG: hypothetical protein N3H31_01595 [Candidatus Nezhaarchaeota archaeon]|nr:hypothetical protein [Candidatus Nezhaarchaeota archaeon]
MASKMMEEKIEQYVKSLFFEAYAEAARILESLRPLREKGEYSEGRYMALHGLLAAAQREDRDALFLKVKAEMKPQEIEEVKRLLKARLSSPVIDEFDKGFLEQWIYVIELVASLKQARGEEGIDKDSNRAPRASPK